MRRIAVLTLGILLTALAGCGFRPKVVQAVTTLEAGAEYDPLSLIRSSDDRYEISVKENHIDVSKLGTYSIVFTIADGSQSANVAYSVSVTDTAAPAIEQTAPYNLPLNSDFAKAFDPAAHFSVTDAYEGDLTKSLTYEGTVDTAQAGSYPITVKAADSSGNTSAKTITVNVLGSGEAPAAAGDPGIAGTYLGHSASPDTAASLVLDKDGSCTFKVNYCSGLAIFTGSYTLSGKDLTLALSDYGLIEGDPQSRYITLSVRPDGSLEYTSPYNACAPVKGDILYKQ